MKKHWRPEGLVQQGYQAVVRSESPVQTPPRLGNAVPHQPKAKNVGASRADTEHRRQVGSIKFRRFRTGRMVHAPLVGPRNDVLVTEVRVRAARSASRREHLAEQRTSRTRGATDDVRYRL